MFWSELKNPFSINVFSRYISEIFMRCSGLSYNPFIQKCFLQKCFWNIHAMFWSELKTLFSRNGFLFPCFRPLSLPISTLLAMLTYRDLQLSIQNTTKHFNTSQNLNTLLISSPHITTKFETWHKWPIFEEDELFFWSHWPIRQLQSWTQ